MQDIFLEIATGESKNALSWTNVKVKWSQLVTKCMARFDTHETFAAYMAGTPEFKTKQKDVGAFVSGYLQGGSRSKSAVLFKQLVTLDADYTANDPGFHARIKSMPFTLMYYTTHTHSPANPRYRILIPLDRPATVDEYEPIARRIAEALGIENMDKTSYELNRLMFWPSSSIDGVFDSGFVQGLCLSADRVLASYRDYKDSSAWPRAQGESIAVRNEAAKLGNPAEKPGIIGAFCQVYDAETCVGELLSAYYTRSDSMPDRFTYNFSTTSNGLVFYEGGDYAFSHHASDPVNTGHPHNAFDLMRIHMFSEAEDNMSLPMSKRKSYLQAEEFAMSIPEVKAVINSQHRTAKEDFVDWSLFGVQKPEVYSQEPDGKNWYEDLETDKKGKPLSTAHNIGHILSNDPVLKGCFAYDRFANRLVLTKMPGWRSQNPAKDFNDTDDAYLRTYFETVYSISGEKKIVDALTVVSDRAGFHPVRKYLSDLNWDGVRRIETLFNVFLGAEDTEYLRAISRAWFTAAVARIFRPGVKFDNMIIFVGEEGIGKSTLINKLGGEWFSDTSIDLRNKKDSMEDLQGVWIMEWGELTAFRTASVEAVKAFVGKNSDRFRQAYGRRVDTYPRQCIFMGSTNVMEFLHDPDGNRRFWPVLTFVTPPVLDIHKDFDEALRGQIWAEAVHMFNSGEPLHLSESMKKIAKEHQQAHTESDGGIPAIDDFLSWELPNDWYKKTLMERLTWIASRKPGDTVDKSYVKRSKVCVEEIWIEALGRDKRDMSHQKTRFVKKRLSQLGWVTGNTTTFGPYPSQRGFVKI